MFNERFVFENIKNSISRVKDRVYQKITDFDIEIYFSKEPLSFQNRLTGEKRKISIGDKWGDLFDCAWFHCTATLPEESKGKKIVYVIDINGEGLIYDDSGCPFRGITNVNSAFDRAMGNPGKRIVPYKESAEGGEHIDFWMDAGCNDLCGNLQSNGTLKEAYVASCNDIARELFYDMTVLVVQAENTLNDDPIKYELIDTLSRCRKILVKFTDDEFEQCLKITKSRLSLKGGDSPALSLTAFGHAHIDLAWLWPIRETKRKGARTFSTAIELMGRYDEYLFGASQPQLYDWVKKDYPGLYEKVKKSVAENRWELLGAVWVEPDANLISGESMVRQILYGNAFWKKEFGKTVDFVWMPDTFGYSASMPQILKKSGINYFATIKMSWNLINEFKPTSFRWKGIDGSEVLVHIPPEGNYLSEGTAKSVLKIKRKLCKSGQFGEMLLPFGIGDGGGGPSPSHLEYLRREDNLPGLCPIKQGKMSEFFERLEHKREELPVWNDEMYLERHLGVYTSAARNKRYNRLMELALRDTEILSSLAFRCCDYAYPAEELENIWKEVLLYQFHDVLPGSSIQRVYDESLARYELLFHRTNELKMLAAKKIAAGLGCSFMKKPVAIFNTLSFERDCFVESENGIQKLTLPALGYKIVDLSAEGGIQKTENPLENEYLRVTLNSDGSIASIYNKELNAELLRGDSNLFYIYDDFENAWNLQYDYRNQTPERVVPDSVVTGDSKYGRYILQHYTYGNSEFEIKMQLKPESRVLEFTFNADWHEYRKMLRIVFCTDVDSPYVTCETQFGHITRSVKSNTSVEQAQIEMPAHKWIALARPGLNFALLNDCKYGYSVEENVIELNALRGTNYPAKELDFGRHTFRYGIYSDSGTDMTDTVKQAYAFNVEPVVCPVSGKTDSELCKSFFEIKAENVIVDGIKKAEDSDALVLRTYECGGRTADAAVNSNLLPNGITLCDLRELPLTQVENTVKYKPFEIVSMII